MIENLEIYVVWSFLVASYCWWMTLNVIKLKRSIDYIRLFINLSLLNTIQGIAYIAFAFSQIAAEYLATTYLIVWGFLFAHLIMLALSMSAKPISRFVINSFYVFPIFVAILHAAGLTVEDYRVESGSLMHDDGALGWVFDIYILASAALTLAIFIFNSWTIKNDRLLASRNMIALISFFPLALMFAILIVLSTTKYAMPVVIIIPLISLHIILWFSYCSRSRVIDITVGPANLVKRFKILWQGLETMKTRGELKDVYEQAERQLINEQMEIHNDDKDRVAKEMETSRATLDRRLKS